MIVYKLTNLINGKVYIGQTSSSLERRLSYYKFGETHENYGKTQNIMKAIRKYGFKNFSATILEKCAKENVNAREIYWIQKLNSAKMGYNISLGGKNVWLVPSIREKIIAAQKGKSVSEETKRKISISLMGHGFSPETLEKMSLAKLGIIPWNKGTKGMVKVNSGSFSSDKVAPNKGRKRITINNQIKFVTV